MNAEPEESSLIDDAVPLQARAGLRLALRAYEYAKDVDRKLWDFAVEMASMKEVGLATSDLRWLVCKGYLEHAREITVHGASERQFQKEVALTFSKRTCFVVTKAGARAAAFAGACQDGFVTGQGNPSYHTIRNTTERPNGGFSRGTAIPTWDQDRRELRLEGRLVKVFRLPSPNQEMILGAFAEENWPPRIDDPLPPSPEMAPKQRLRDAIRNLNRNQKAPLIHFMGDGSGEGILWEMAVTNGASEIGPPGARFPLLDGRGP